MAIIAKLAQIPIAALLPSVRPVDSLGATPAPDIVEFRTELGRVVVAGEDKADVAVAVADGPLLGKIVRAPMSPGSEAGCQSQQGCRKIHPNQLTIRERFAGRIIRRRSWVVYQVFPR